jgi:predicted aldo/keto reductase-like oxidoreductase
MKEISTENIVKEIQSFIDKGVPYIDAVVEYAEKNEVEIEVIGQMIRSSPILKAKIQYEAEELNMMDKTDRLPV